MFYMRLYTQRYQSMTTHSKFSKAILFAIHIKNQPYPRNSYMQKIEKNPA